MEKERQEKRTKWQRGTRAGNGRRQQGKATREIKWETRKTGGNYFLFLYVKKNKKAHRLVFHFVLSVH